MIHQSNIYKHVHLKKKKENAFEYLTKANSCPLRHGVKQLSKKSSTLEEKLVSHLRDEGEGGAGSFQSEKDSRPREGEVGWCHSGVSAQCKDIDVDGCFLHIVSKGQHLSVLIKCYQ